MDLESVLKYLLPFATAVFTIGANRIAEKRPKVLWYWGHISSFRVRGTPQPDEKDERTKPSNQTSKQHDGSETESSQKRSTDNAPPSDFDINAHSLVVLNSGRKTANNVRIIHVWLPPNFQVRPLINYEVKPLPDGAQEILIPKLVAGNQITISYLYVPPATWSQIHSSVEFDDGPAKFLNVLPAPQWPLWRQRLAKFVLLIGIASIAYFLVDIGFYVSRTIKCINQFQESCGRSDVKQ